MAIVQNLGQVSAFWVSTTTQPPITNVLWFRGDEPTGYDVLYWAGNTLQWQLLTTGGGSGNVTIQTTAPISGGAGTPQSSYTLTFDVNNLPTLPALSNDTFIPVYDVLTDAFYKYNLQDVGGFLYETFTATQGQTIFNLGTVPTQLSRVQVFVNGIKYVYGRDFNIVGSVLNWLNTPFILQNGFTLDVYL